MLGIQTILAINGWEQALKEGFPIFDTLIRIILVPLIMTLVFSPLFAKKEKKIGKDGYTKLMQLCSDKDINEIQIELSKNDGSSGNQKNSFFTQTTERLPPWRTGVDVELNGV